MYKPHRIAPVPENTLPVDRHGIPIDRARNMANTGYMSLAQVIEKSRHKRRAAQTHRRKRS